MTTTELGAARVSNAVLAAKLDHVNQSLAHVVEEMRALRAESVGRELYDAHRAALLAELARVTEECRNGNAAMRRDVDRLRDELAGERDRNSSLRRTIIASLITAGAGIVTAIIGLLA